MFVEFPVGYPVSSIRESDSVRRSQSLRFNPFPYSAIFGMLNVRGIPVLHDLLPLSFGKQLNHRNVLLWVPGCALEYLRKMSNEYFDGFPYEQVGCILHR